MGTLPTLGASSFQNNAISVPYGDGIIKTEHVTAGEPDAAQGPGGGASSAGRACRDAVRGEMSRMDGARRVASKVHDQLLGDRGRRSARGESARARCTSATFNITSRGCSGETRQLAHAWSKPSQHLLPRPPYLPRRPHMSFARPRSTTRPRSR